MSSSDPIDQASDRELMDTASAVDAVRMAAAKFEKGQPGTCIHCGEDFIRLVRGRCGGCRDELGLP